VALVDDDQRVLRQVVEQRRRRLAGAATGQVAGVVLDAVAVADFANHLQVEHRPLVQPLRLEQTPVGFELAAPLGQFGLDRLDGAPGALARGHEMRLRVDRGLVVAAERLSGQRVERRQLVDLVAEQLDPQPLLFVGRKHLDDVAADAEGAAAEIVIVALVLDFDELAQDLFPLDPLSPLERQQHPVIGFRRSQAVDARHAGDDDDIASLEERSGRRQTHAIDLVVDRRFLLDIRVGRRHVGFGLVVVVVADEVLDGVVGKEPAELLVELRRQGLVVDHHQRRPVHAGDGLRHGEGLARAGHPEQHLMRIAALESLGELANRPLLIAGERKVRDQIEAIVNGGHGNWESYYRAEGLGLRAEGGRGLREGERLRA
jgi:hypothetical protein